MLGASLPHRVEVFFLHLKSQEKHHLELVIFPTVRASRILVSDSCP